MPELFDVEQSQHSSSNNHFSNGSHAGTNGQRPSGGGNPAPVRRDEEDAEGAEKPMHPGDVMTSKQRAEETEEHQRFPTRSVSDPAVTKAFAIEAARMLADDRCEDVLCLDVRSLSQVSDFIIVASGTSDRQMRSAGDDVAKLAQTSGYGVMRRSQDERATWIVLDCVDVVVHIFEPNTRAHYDLEMLWGDATHIDWRRPGSKDGASQRGYAGARGGVTADNAAESDEPDFGTDEDYSTGEDDVDDAGESGVETDDATAGMTDEELEIATRPDAPVATKAAKPAAPPPKKPGLAKRAVLAVKKALSKKPAKGTAKGKPATKAKTTANAKTPGASKKGVKPPAKAATKKASGKPAKASKNAASAAKKSGKVAKGTAKPAAKKAPAAKGASKKTAKKKR